MWWPVEGSLLFTTPSTSWMILVSKPLLIKLFYNSLLERYKLLFLFKYFGNFLRIRISLELYLLYRKHMLQINVSLSSYCKIQSRYFLRSRADRKILFRPPQKWYGHLIVFIVLEELCNWEQKVKYFVIFQSPIGWSNWPLQTMYWWELAFFFFYCGSWFSNEGLLGSSHESTVWQIA